MMDIGYPGGGSSTAFSVNDVRQIAGFNTLTPTGAAQAFVYSNGAFTELGIVGGAQAINSAGQIAGYGTFSDGARVSI
jgi:uncharacterized membrane protein